jgi:hypothetical protein
MATDLDPTVDETVHQITGFTKEILGAVSMLRDHQAVTNLAARPRRYALADLGAAERHYRAAVARLTKVTTTCERHPVTHRKPG